MLDKDMLEFLGHAFLNAAHSQRQVENMNTIIGQKFEADNEFINSLLKTFKWRNYAEKDVEDFVELIRKSSGAYKEFIQAYLTLFNVVSQEEHLSLKKENDELKAKIAELEEIRKSTINSSNNNSYDPQRIVDNLTQIMSNQTQQFQELMKKMNPPDKKTTAAKKK
jgi:cell division septum initiation protein DivIVA